MTSEEGFQIAESRIARAKTKGARSIDLSRLNLTELPESLAELEEVTALGISENSLQELPEFLGELTKLTRLDAHDNGLATLPRSLANLTQLEELTLHENKFENFPEVLGKLLQLRLLSLSFNTLKSLPESIGELTNLEDLWVHSNRLHRLPESLGRLTNLKNLDLQHNNITALPKNIGKLASLKYLDLAINDLSELPHDLLGLISLRALYLHDNPKLKIPDEILGDRRVGKASSDILDYYFRVHPPRETDSPRGRPLLEARIIVIGDGAAGKTSLVRQLLKDLPAQENEASTRDVVIANWDVTLKDSRVQINVWDFGGQKQMHAAHPYFFTTRTLYLVVAEARKDQQDRVDYWLKMVAKYGENARALVVINKVDGHAMALDRPKLLGRYRNNLPENSRDAFFPTACTTGAGIPELRSAIHREIENMSQVWALWPDEWFRVKQAIIKLRETSPQTSDTLTFDAWTQICNDCEIKDAKDREKLLENLGHLGRVICFPKDAHLCHLGVLNPEWVTRGIYPLLVETTLAAKGGLLTMADLAGLLSQDRYPMQRHAWLVQLMKAFELIFQDSEANLFLPGQLPADSPDWAQPQNWNDEVTLHLELRYDGVLPESVISQFIVRRCREVRNPGEWWRHGIALKRGHCQALVRAHTAEQEAKIELRVRGPRHERRDFLTSIREGLHDPKDSRPPELHVILSPDCAPPYKELLIHAAARKRELDLVINGRSEKIKLADILDMIEAPDQQQVASHVSPPGVQNNFYAPVHNQNAPNMNTENYSNTGHNQGIIGKHNTQNISHSFNTQGADLGTLLQALDRLHQAAKKLPKAEAEAVAPELATLATGAKRIEAEIKKENPNQGLLQLTKDGMITAAKTCAAMAPPLLEAAKAVADWFA